MLPPRKLTAADRRPSRRKHRTKPLSSPNSKKSNPLPLLNDEPISTRSPVPLPPASLARYDWLDSETRAAVGWVLKGCRGRSPLTSDPRLGQNSPASPLSAESRIEIYARELA